MRSQKSFAADIYLELNLEFWQDLEQHCVAECCGIDAFDFSYEQIKETISFYDKADIIENLTLLLNEIEKSDLKNVSSSIFNEYSKKKIFAERIKRIKKNILL